MDPKDFKPISPNPQNGLFSGAHVTAGIPIPKTKRVEMFNAQEWEEFTEEWASSLVANYHLIRRYAGSGDEGLDVVGFKNSTQFVDGWDNYQCKYYDHALYPSDIWVEIGKVIYYSFLEHYPPPVNYYFVAPFGVGTSLGKLLADFIQLKSGARDHWDQFCRDKITSTQSVPLEGQLLTHFESFDFSIFRSVSTVEMIKAHATTTFHTVRFGGGLSPRPPPEIPPEDSVSTNHRYVRQLLSVFAEAMGVPAQPLDLKLLDADQKHKVNFHRQRERFYHAESLRNFSRDTVPPGTFESLQDDIYQGVVDLCESQHASGLDCMTKTLAQAAKINVESNPLVSVTKVADKQGICHQLVDSSRLSWRDSDE